MQYCNKIFGGLIMICLLVNYSVCIAQDATLITEIKEQYNKINAEKKLFKVKAIDDYDASTEGGRVTAYYKEGMIQLIVADYYGESRKGHSQYYFANGQIVFIVDEISVYNVPFYIKKDTANGVVNGFDERETKLEIDRYYFHKNKLIKWIDKNNKVVTVNSRDFQKSEQDQLKEVQRIVKLLK